MELKFPQLKADDIEVKVKKITSKGVIVLLYKTARVDMNVLDQIVGPLNWKCSYRDVKGNLYCEISIYDSDKKEWVSKEDCGIESRDDGEGNQHKGEASDAFKRAGFKWGIGRELYTAPFTFIHCATRKKQDGRSYEMENPFIHYSVKSIGYDKDAKINSLVIADDKGNEVYNMKAPIMPAAAPKQQEPPQQVAEIRCTANEINALHNEILRTGGSEKEWLEYVGRHITNGPKPQKLEDISKKEFLWSMAALAKHPDKKS